VWEAATVHPDESFHYIVHLYSCDMIDLVYPLSSTSCYRGGNHGIRSLVACESLLGLLFPVCNSRGR